MNPKLILRVSISHVYLNVKRTAHAVTTVRDGIFVYSARRPPFKIKRVAESATTLPPSKRLMLQPAQHSLLRNPLEDRRGGRGEVYLAEDELLSRRLV